MKKILAATIAGAALVVLPAIPAGARAGDVRVAGTCSATSTSKLKVSPRPSDGIVQVEFQVDQNVAGQTWNVTIVDNGTTAATGSRVTNTLSGAFTFRRRIPDQVGPDAVTATALNPASGESCTASATV